MAVLLILVDGMRPDSLRFSGTAQKILPETVYTLEATTVYPSITLPCHVSLVTSTDPKEHGTVTNSFTPWPETVNGLFEVLREAGKKAGFFFNWEELRDISKPGSVAQTAYFRPDAFPDGGCNERSMEEAEKFWLTEKPDFVFLYLGNPDYVGHACGWMGEEYLASVEASWRRIERMMAVLGPDDDLIVTADHGGHGTEHGSKMREDMTIPLILKTKRDVKAIGKRASILDIAPTVAAMLGAAPDPSWKGRSLV